ncbi:hypothetical protein BX600DRAFT_433110 [Xylariales sp. PMI_506]|nr:hypothetical protein BX600DRAFT_433110 [Xylariales sp. PMI_506]
MSRLLAIPREIRDQVIQHVLSHQLPAPTTEAAFDTKDRQTLPYAKSEGWEHVYLERRPQYGRDARMLMLVNRQLFHEVQDVSRIEANRMPDYTLDVAFLKDVTFRPTWLSVPALAPRIDTLLARFRILDLPRGMELTYGMKHLYMMGLGDPPRITWGFYHVLLTSLRFGPLGAEYIVSGPATPDGSLQSQCDMASVIHEQGITVKTLVIDFQSEAEPGILLLMPTWMPRTNERFRAGHALCAVIRRQIQGLLSMNHYTREYGKFLYERVGNIEIRLDGKKLYDFDLNARFEKLRHDDDAADHEYPSAATKESRCERRRRFDTWKNETAERRTRARLA